MLWKWPRKIAVPTEIEAQQCLPRGSDSPGWGILESDTVEYGHKSHWTRTREWLRWQGPAIVNDIRVLSSERVAHTNKHAARKQRNVRRWKPLPSNVTENISLWSVVMSCVEVPRKSTYQSKTRLPSLNRLTICAYRRPLHQTTITMFLLQMILMKYVLNILLRPRGTPPAWGNCCTAGKLVLHTNDKKSSCACHATACGIGPAVDDSFIQLGRIPAYQVRSPGQHGIPYISSTFC
jgi:hypothetical protein